MAKSTQTILVSCLILGALGFGALAILYQADGDIDANTSESPTSAPDDAKLTSSDTGGTASANPIRRLLPSGNAAVACTETIGAIVASNYGATLTLNGIELTPSELNVNLDASGKITNQVTASRSVGEYSYQPNDNCPDGRYLQAKDNVLSVCAWLLADESQRCAAVATHKFDAG